MKGIYPKSIELQELIEGCGWSLYDVSQTAEGRSLKWHEIEKSGPAQQFEVGHNYIFAPTPKNGQTLRQAYATTMGIGPSLRIEDPDDSRWVALIVREKPMGYVALFSRLFFERDYVVASSPPSALSDSDIVMLKYKYLLDTFQKYFVIANPEDFGLPRKQRN